MQTGHEELAMQRREHSARLAYTVTRVYGCARKEQFMLFVRGTNAWTEVSGLFRSGISLPGRTECGKVSVDYVNPSACL